jgi:hypothetical protein
MAAKYMNDALQNPHPEVTFTHVGDVTSSNFQTQITTNPVTHDSSCASHGQTTQIPC